MGFYTDHILPHCIDYALSRPPILEMRARVTRELEGRVFEIGIGSGLNFPYYPSTVSEVVALDPALNARRRAQRRSEERHLPMHWVELPDESGKLPLDDASVDCVLSTFTLCTIPQVATALSELRRVLKPRGKFYFLEHGRSPEPRVARWQARLTPLQRRLAGNCHLDRRIDDLLREAGFCLDALQTYPMPDLPALLHAFEGAAHVCRKDAPDSRDRGPQL